MIAPDKIPSPPVERSMQPRIMDVSAADRTASEPADQKAYAALERLLKQVRSGRITGNAAIKMDLSQGGVRSVEISVTERL